MKNQKSPKKKSAKSKDDFFAFAANHLSAESLRKADSKAKIEIMNIKLAQLREALGIKQTELIGFSQSGVSKLESREDMKLSTFLEYLEAIDMEVEIYAHPRGKNAEEDQIELLNTGT